MRYEEEKVQAANNYLNKIWNSARYILMTIPEDFKNQNVDTKKLNSIDKYILTKLEETVKKVTKYMDKYEYGIASSVLYNFVYDDFCSTYLEYTKVSLNNENNYNYGTYRTLLKVLKAVVMMIYPFSPFISEEIYLNLPEHKDSVMLEDYPVFEKKFVFAKDIRKVNKLNQAIESIRSYKVNNKLAPNTSISLSVMGDFSKDLLPYLARFSFAKDSQIVKEEVKNSTAFVLDGFTLFIIDNVDKSELINTLKKQQNGLESEIKRSEGLLNNSNFVAKAPKAKIDIETAKYENYKKQLEEILNKIKNLG
jgi:valyl-tRNA synthetase